MKILGPFLSVDDPDTFFFMRSFPDLESRDQLKASSTRGSSKRELKQKLIPMIEKYQHQVLSRPNVAQATGL